MTPIRLLHKEVLVLTYNTCLGSQLPGSHGQTEHYSTIVLYLSDVCLAI